MARAPKIIDRDTQLATIIDLEGKIGRLTRSETVENAVKHASFQIAYWRARQILASMDTHLGGDDPSADQEDRMRIAYVESRKCTESAEMWQRTLNASRKLLVARELEELKKLITAQGGAAAALRGIETT